MATLSEIVTDGPGAFMNLSKPKALAAELFGTFFLVLAAAGSGAVNGMLGGVVGGTSSSVAVGWTVAVMILCFGPVSGGHFNPAVTLGAALAGRLPKERVLQYFAAQLLGAVLAALFLKLVLDPAVLGTTSSRLHWASAWAMEAVLTFLLVWVVLSVTEKDIPLLATALGIGFILATCGLWAGPTSGASLNPARSLGPALVALDFSQIWIYLTAPFAGGALAAKGYGWYKSLA